MIKVHVDDKVIVAVTGLPGSGKSAFLRIAKDLSYYPVVMGDFVRKEAANRNLPLTSENLGKLMFQMRKERGDDIIAQLTIEEVTMSKSPFVIIDGVRNPEEIDKFKKIFKRFHLIALESLPKNRFNRIMTRYRSDDSTERKKFDERDARELKVGVGQTIKQAEFVIDNNSSLDTFKVKAKNVLEEITHGC